MAERPVIFEGANLGLVVGVVALALATGFVWLGPGREGIEASRRDVDERQRRIDGWERRRGDARAVTPDEHREWERRWEVLASFGPRDDEDETALMAWVARRFGGPTVRDLQVTRGDDVELDDEEETPLLAAGAPDGSRGVELRSIPLQVRFEARYSDVSEILRRLERNPSPLQIERVDLRRRYPDVRVELDLALWTRKETSS